MKRNTHKKKYLQLITILSILVISSFFIYYTWSNFKKNQANEILHIAKSIVAALPKEGIRDFELSLNDTLNPKYKILKSNLSAIVKENPKARFAYLYSKKNNKLVFIADSEPKESKDYSPPGQEYTEANTAYFLAFDNKTETIIGPVTDRWGNWMSVLIPIKDIKTGEIKAVYGMDFNSNEWNSILFLKLFESTVWMFLFFSLLLLVYKIKSKNKTLRNDIIKQKQIEEKLIESEHHLRTIYESEPDCIAVLDELGKLIQINPAGLHLVQADSFDQIIGQNAINVIVPEFQKGFLEIQKGVLQGKSIQKEFEIIGLKGKRLWVESHCVPMQYNGKTVVLCLARNITNRKITEETLEESKLFLAETQKISNLGTYVLDIQNESWISSDILDSIFGIDKDFDKTTQAWASIIHPEWKNQMLEYYATEIIQNKSKFDKEYQIIRQSDNLERWVHGYGELQLDDNNQAFKMIGTIQDITQKKMVEEELFFAKEKAEESDRLKSAFLANMSHEIRTPLNGIMGFAELLKEPDLSVNEQQEFVSIIEKSSEHLLGIINDIIDISKIESGLVPVTISETNINEQIEQIYNFFKPEINDKGIHFSFKNGLENDKSLIKSDSKKIYAILTNLVKNAIKFTSNGSIEFGYNLKTVINPSEETSNTIKEQSELEFYIKDTGIGISKNQKKLVFERFRQASESITRDYEGAGLGLSISKAFVEMLGGKIWIESKKRIGSTFYFTIPYNLVEKSSESIEVILLNNDSNLKKIKILIAEDDEISAYLITKSVQAYAKEIIRTKTGLETLSYCESNSDIDLILMDIQMPEMSGYEATKKIRKFNSDVIIIAQTASAFNDTKIKTLEIGCNDYLLKPIKKEDFKDLMHKYFRIKEN